MLFVGDDWAEDHHDVEIQDEAGRRLGTAKLEEGIGGIARLHALIGQQLGEDDAPVQVVIGIETDRGPWVQALIAAGYQVHAINPLQVARYRERRGVSGAKSDAGDAHALADMVRTDRHQLRPVAGDSEQAEAVKVVTRGAQDTDLGTHPPHVAAAADAAGVLPRRPGRVRRPDRPGRPAPAGQGHRPCHGGPVDDRADHRRPEAGPPP